MQIQKFSKSWYSGVISSGVLLVLIVVAMLCPIVPEGAGAVEDTPVAYASTSNTPSISMALSARTELDVTPTASGAFQTGTANLRVAVNLPEGYKADGFKIYMTSVDGNTLKGTGSNSATIGPTSESTLGGGHFPNNTWGYSIYKSGSVDSGSVRYNPVPSNNTMIYSTSDLADIYDLAFATKVDMNIPADQYSGSVVVSVIAEPRVATLLDITNMQEMTAQVCTESNEGDTKQLIDTRDNKSYWVAKMKDGNCWMTQNLALDITTAGLKAVDTDITADWNSSSTYRPKATTNTIPTSNLTNNDTLSWNLSGVGTNQWVLGTPLKTTACSNNSITDVAYISTCTNVGFVRVNNTWNSTFDSYNGVWSGTGDYAGRTTYITADPANKKYDAHYLTGNYYQWNTATAGTGGGITSGDAAGSICPKGWQLPGISSGSTHPTFNDLLSKYGVDSKLSTTGSNAMPDMENGLYNIAAAPLYFVRSGFINESGGGYWGSGRDGDIWSSTPTTAGSRCLSISGTGVALTTYAPSSRGYSVRCVAR